MRRQSLIGIASASVSQINSCGHPVFDKALKDLQFIRIEPCEIAVAAAVDLNEVGKAVKSPQHWTMALRTANQRFDTFLFCLPFFHDELVLIVLFNRACEGFDSFRALSFSSGDDPRQSCVVDKDSSAITTLVDLRLFIGDL